MPASGGGAGKAGAAADGRGVGQVVGRTARGAGGEARPPRALGTILRNHFAISDDVIRDALIEQSELRRQPGGDIEGSRIGEILVRRKVLS